MGPLVLGRDQERDAIDRAIEATRKGLSSALVLRGEAGMGKTTLLDYAVAAAPELRVLRLAGVESESEFGFGGLHRLLLPFAADIERLPGRQRAALESAFGLVTGAPADRFIIGLAALSLLSNAARRQPLLCIVDDAQWLDRESLDALAFVARRLRADRIALLFAVRDTANASGPPFDGLSVVAIEGLHEDAALDLLAAVVDGPIDQDVARKIVAETSGCPLAVVELARGLSAKQLAGGGSLPEPLPIGGRLERHFLAQVRTLPEATQTFLLLAAADASTDATIIWRAADELGIPSSAADAAVSAQLIGIDPRVEFRHPLIRSAILNGAHAAERRGVHRALASVSDADGHADQRAWHLAAATIGTDEAVAVELERGGQRAASRGRYAAEAAFYERAAALTPSPSRRAERLLAAAQAHVTAGAHDAATTMLREAAPLLTGPVSQAQAQRLQAALHSFTLPNEIPAVLLDAARALEPLDVRLARDTYTEAIEAVLVSGQLTKGTTRAEIAHAALAAPPPPEIEPTVADIVLEGFSTRFVVGYAAAAPILHRGIAALISTPFSSTGISRGSTLGSNAAAELWDAEGYGAMLAQLEATERERGALDSLRITLGGLGHYDMWSGRFALAEARHSEAAEISRALGADPRVWELLKVELFAWQGRDAETRAVVDALMGPFVRASGAGVAVNLAHIALSLLEIAQGRYQEALDAAAPLVDEDLPPHGSQALPEIVEAASRSGHEDRATAAYAELETRARASGTPWALGLLARSRALLADDVDADAHYREAIELIGTTVVKTDLARAHLLYGEWLRRQKQRQVARDQLAIAYDLFNTMGATAFAERARIELTATGATARRRSVETAQDLTGQEHQVARLAADGATNNEIAATLFLSASTVDYHLRKVYRKLGITSRRQLRTAIPE
jgi:DNA-binding CsgD family transcriptional regulator